MNTAFEITPNDVAAVLRRHGKVKSHDDPLIEQVFDGLDVDRVEKAALYYTDLDDQTASALDEIENILIEEAVIQPPKRFQAP
jgi:hypothetical protein